MMDSAENAQDPNRDKHSHPSSGLCHWCYAICDDVVTGFRMRLHNEHQAGDSPSENGSLRLQQLRANHSRCVSHTKKATIGIVSTKADNHEDRQGLINVGREEAKNEMT